MPTEPLAVLIVDDEPLARLRLRGLIDALATEAVAARVVGEAGDAAQALAWLTGHDCDLVLLDIAMPGPDGLRLAEAIRQRAAPPAVVFVTAHAEHALKAFDLEAVDYLTKPVRRDRLAVALARVQQRRSRARAAAGSAGLDNAGAGRAAGAGAEPVLVVNDRGRVLRVPLTELLYLRAEQKYVTLVSVHGRWLLDEPLAELETQLGEGALRVHRNAVVARHAVRALERRAGDEPAAEPGEASDESWQVQLANGDWLAVSRRQLAAVRAALADASER